MPPRSSSSTWRSGFELCGLREAYGSSERTSAHVEPGATRIAWNDVVPEGVKTGCELSTNAASDDAPVVHWPPSTSSQPRTCESMAAFEAIPGMLTVPVIVLQFCTVPLVTVTCRMATSRLLATLVGMNGAGTPVGMYE